VLERTDGGGHLLPGNDLLPEHEGMVITRGLREWACLLPLDVGTETAQRLLGWITQEPGVLSASEVRCLVRERTREAVLQAARRVDPGATEAQITTPPSRDCSFRL
jgi:hypothetical protein